MVRPVGPKHAEKMPERPKDVSRRMLVDADLTKQAGKGRFFNPNAVAGRDLKGRVKLHHPSSKKEDLCAKNVLGIGEKSPKHTKKKKH